MRALLTASSAGDPTKPDRRAANFHPLKTLFRLCVALALGSILEGAADNSSVIAAVLAADEARMTAMKTGVAAGLDAIFSDELRYAHSSGAQNGL